MAQLQPSQSPYNADFLVLQRSATTVAASTLLMSSQGTPTATMLVFQSFTDPFWDVEAKDTIPHTHSLHTTIPNS
jgi:hypothetical protein